MSSPCLAVSVVDDDVEVRAALARLVASAGYQTREYGSGDAFLRDFEQQRTQCVVLDLQMPGTSGFDVLRSLAQRQIAVPVVNASISGETSSGGLSRLPALLEQHHPGVLIIELGGNDALRGLPMSMTQANLASMAKMGREADAQVVIVGMQVPPNYGKRYAQEFASMFQHVAKEQHARLVPFLLAGVADSSDGQSLFQADRIHPTMQAQPRMLDNVWPVLEPLLH